MKTIFAAAAFFLLTVPQDDLKPLAIGSGESEIE